MELVSTALSILAFVVSAYVLWETHIKPFRPRFMIGNVGIRFFQTDIEVGTEDETLNVNVWVPVVTVRIAVHNEGSRPGQITDMRLVLASDKLTLVFHPGYEVDPTKTQTSGEKSKKLAKPSEFRKKLYRCDWEPFLLSKDQLLQREYVFELHSIGMRHVPTGDFDIALECTVGDESKWRRVGTLDFEIDAWVKETLERGESFGLKTINWDRRKQIVDVDKDRLLMDEEIENKLGIENNQD